MEEPQQFPGGITGTNGAPLISVMALFSATWQRFTRRWGTAVILMLLEFGATLLLGILSAFLIAALVTSTASLVFIFILSLVLLFITFLISSVVFAMLVHLFYEDAKPSLRTLLSFNLKRAHSYLWITVLGAFFVIGGFIAFVIPGVLFSVWILFAIPSAVIEEKRGARALSRSRQLVHGYWWAVFGRLLLLLLVSMVFSLVFSIVFGGNDTQGYQIANWIFNIFFIPFTAAYLTILYKNLRAINGVRTEKVGSRKSIFYFAVLGFIGAFALLFFLSHLVPPSREFQLLNSDMDIQQYLDQLQQQ